MSDNNTMNDQNENPNENSGEVENNLENDEDNVYNMTNSDELKEHNNEENENVEKTEEHEGNNNDLTENSKEKNDPNELDPHYSYVEKDTNKTSKYFDIYEWVDSFKFSGSKKNMTRDFSDGVYLMEICQSITSPPIIEKNVINHTSKRIVKLENWKLIIEKFNNRSIFKITEKESLEIIDHKPYAIENLLYRLNSFLKSNKTILLKINPNVNAKDHMKSIQSKVSPEFKENETFKMETKKNLDVKLKSKEELFTDIISEKDNVISELKGTCVMLKDKITRQRDENSIYEEIINRYRLKMERLGDFEIENSFNDLFGNYDSIL